MLPLLYGYYGERERVCDWCTELPGEHARKEPHRLQRRRQELRAYDAALGDRLGILLPPGFTAEGKDVLDALLSELPGGPLYAFGVRHRSWVGFGLTVPLCEHGAALTLVVCPRMPRLEEDTPDFSYMGWLGDRCEFLLGHVGQREDRTEDLRWWSGLVARPLEEGRTVFAYASNHYQNHSLSTVEQFLDIRSGEQD